MNAPVNQATFVLQFARTLWREILLHKGKILFCYAVVSLVVVSFGLVFPKKYETSTTLYADQQNIIKPLLSGKAAITKVQNQAKVVKEVIYSPRILNQVVVDAKLVKGGETPAQIEKMTNRLRAKIKVKNIGSNFIRLTYTDNSPDVTYDVLTSVSDHFIRDTSERKRKESREAFQFIASQVKTYKNQLQEAEQKLKRFKSTNVDGTEATARGRISELQAQLEEMKLDIDDAQIRMKSLERELKAENQFINKRFRSEVYLEQIRQKQKVLDTLKLTYTDTYPDVVSIRLQIEDLQRALTDSENETDDGSSEGASNQKGRNINPLYEELRSKLSTAKVELATRLRRQQGTERLLSNEEKRLKRVAARQADLSELTRDYEVTRSIYEGMLGRKETARLSMTLDIEGQGVKYKIQEPAAYPLTPKGIRFFHFALAGPVAGVLAPIALLMVFILLDPRIRFVDKVKSVVSVPVLGVVPHIHTSLSKRIFKADIILLGVFVILVMSVYVGIILARHNSII
ncbi:hypothetical protein A9Q81_11445 [Gammaproteobacteria bacterium 42_54_T18]|nr:hypothetical protein A9Q81_11445 [Gammaproteobacteria bacterium 42_54_T18]